MPSESNIQEMYKGTIRVKYVESNHGYYVSKKEKGGWTPFERATGVTTFIGAKDKSVPMKYWVARITTQFLIGILETREVTKFDIKEARDLHTKRLEEAATIGTKIHAFIEDEITGKNPAMPQEDVVLQGANAFLNWRDEHKVKFLESEILLYSKEHSYCGRADAIVQIGKKRYLLDFKTSNGIYNDVMLQTAAYAHAYEEMGLGKIDGRWELRLEKRTPDEFQAEMDDKGKVNEVYKPFEALELPGTQEDDFAGFLSFKSGYAWDKKSSALLKQALEK